MCTPVISINIWKWSIHYASLSAMFKLIHSSMNQSSHYENTDSSTVQKGEHLCNQGCHCEKYDDFCHKGSQSHVSPNQHFLPSTKMNGTQRRTVVSPWRIHCTTLVCQKAPLELKRHRTYNKRFKHIALVIIALHLSEGISQLVTQSFTRKFHYIKTLKIL